MSLPAIVAALILPSSAWAGKQVEIKLPAPLPRALALPPMIAMAASAPTSSSNHKEPPQALPQLEQAQAASTAGGGDGDPDPEHNAGFGGQGFDGSAPFAAEEDPPYRLPDGMKPLAFKSREQIINHLVTSGMPDSMISRVNRYVIDHLAMEGYTEEWIAQGFSRYFNISLQDKSAAEHVEGLARYVDDRTFFYPWLRSLVRKHMLYFMMQEQFRGQQGYDRKAFHRWFRDNYVFLMDPAGVSREDVAARLKAFLESRSTE